MFFDSKEKLMDFLKYNLTFIGSGSQGECYLNVKNNTVYKIFLSYIEDSICYNKKEDILKFSNINNKTFLFANDVVMVNDDVVGYISKYVNATNLYKINPLNVNLNNFEKLVSSSLNDVDNISEKSIRLYDIPYNILLGRKLYVTDFDEFNYVDIDTQKLKKFNYHAFNIELFWFLVDGYFDELVNDNNELKEMYKNKENIILFLKMYRKVLSEYVGFDIDKLNKCKKYLNKRVSLKEPIYQRIIKSR